jgi:hypothetical protein
MTRRLFAAIVFLSLAVTTGPALVRLVRDAASMHKLSMRQRRLKLMGDFYRDTMAILASVPPNEPLALVPRFQHRNEVDSAVFFNYYAYPRPSRLYSAESYVLAKDDPSRPARIVGFAGTPHLADYPQFRAETIVRQPLARNMTQPAIARRDFIVPFVVSLDGPPPNTYTVEALFGADTPANVDVTWFPTGATKRFDVRGTRHLADIAYETSARMGFGWMHITSDVPVRAAFAFVNRGTGAVTPLRIVDELPPMPLRFPPRPGAKLWLVNPQPERLIAMAGGVQAALDPHGIVPMGPELIVTAPKPIFAFLAGKDASGAAQFTWPEGWQ